MIISVKKENVLLELTNFGVNETFKVKQNWKKNYL